MNAQAAVTLPVALTLSTGARAFFVTAQSLIASFEQMFAKDPDKPVSMQQLFSAMHEKAHPFLDRDAEMDRVVPELAAPLTASPEVAVEAAAVAAVGPDTAAAGVAEAVLPTLEVIDEPAAENSESEPETLEAYDEIDEPEDLDR